ncbi:hypothetical protein [Paenibacillus sp. Root444D2]|uniref:hypothetical protein n=1 Tax=Paenibacillus sp. Root444D2 TaxID=1736538 RepID=UPI001F38CDD3|nr:hypothetical protein [Paenibacillus sp. Root444D2]
MMDVKTWFITGAGRGLGVDIAKAALSTGSNGSGTLQKRIAIKCYIDFCLPFH